MKTEMTALKDKYYSIGYQFHVQSFGLYFVNFILSLIFGLNIFHDACTMM